MLGKCSVTELYIHVLALKLTSEDDPAPQIWRVPNSTTSHSHSDRLKLKTDISTPCQPPYLPDPRGGCDPDRERAKSSTPGTRDQKSSTVGTSGKITSPSSACGRGKEAGAGWGTGAGSRYIANSISHTVAGPILFLSR